MIRKMNLALLLSLGFAQIALADIQDQLPDRYLVKLQATAVTQHRAGSPIPSYYDPDLRGLTANAETRTSLTATAFFGIRALRLTEFYLNPELSGGAGLNGSHGIAGFPNGEIYRVDSPTPKFNLARLYVKQTLDLIDPDGGGPVEIAPDQNQVKATYSNHRISVVIGKFSLNDFFDKNRYAHDPRTQFLNWSLMDNGAWDYAADTKGYTLGAMLEYVRGDLSIRFASVMVPETANGLELDSRISDARGDNLEIEYRYKISGHPGAARLLTYLNHARMGDYRQAISQGSPPDLPATRADRAKSGVAVDIEQELSEAFGIFGRFGTNDGKTESWSFTEIDSTASLGFDWQPFAGRADHLGGAYIYNAISTDHRNFLAAGGQGFIVGDGGLNYAPEQIFESYYSWRLVDGVSLTADAQLILNAGYNQDRDPLPVGALRLHFEI